MLINHLKNFHVLVEKKTLKTIDIAAKFENFLSLVIEVRFLILISGINRFVQQCENFVFFLISNKHL